MTLQHAKPVSQEVAKNFCEANDFKLPAGAVADAWFESLDHKHLAVVLFYVEQKFWGFLVIRRNADRCEPDHVGRGMLTRESVEQFIDKALVPVESRRLSPQAR
jgi:hypothetical protein